MAHASRETGSANGLGETSYLVEHYFAGVTAHTLLSTAERARKAAAKAMTRGWTRLRSLKSTKGVFR